MRVSNGSEVRQMWWTFCTDPTLALVAIRHAEKPKDGGARCGCSPRGKEQLELFHHLVSTQIVTMMEGCGCLFCSSSTERNKETIEAMIRCFSRETILYPPALDFPNMGPNDEDLVTARALAKELGIDVKKAFYVLEEHGRTRVGEHPNTARDRVRRGYEEAMQGAGGRIVVYSGNSPVMNEALGIPGSLAELEALFVAREGGEFILLGRVAPIFADE